MKLRLAVTGLVCSAGVAGAGGLFLPGAGAVSTSRAGASVVATDDGEAITLNPAGIAKAGPGTHITLGASIIDYSMSFQRAGNYPDLSAHESTTYAGTPYPKMTNDVTPPLGIGPFQPVPLIAVISDVGGAVPGLHAAFGLYAPNAYPFRDLTKVNGKPWVFNSDIEAPPPPTRYDMMHEEAAVILPTLAVAYTPIPDLDIGARFSLGVATVKSTVAIWGLQNHEEWQQQDGTFTLDAKGVVWTAGMGVNYRLTPEIEIGANYTLPITVHAKGDATAQNGPAVNIGGAAVLVVPKADDAALCEKGGTAEKLKGCADFELPMTAQVGGRYKFLAPSGKLKGDVELDVGWEKWGSECKYQDATGALTDCQNPSDFHITVDARVTTTTDPNGGIDLHSTQLAHGFQDVYNARLGGSWVFPLDEGHDVIARGGLSYDTAAAKPGWERVDLDGAARTMIAAGASYKTKRLSIDAGFAFIYEGTRTNNRNCVVTGQVGSEGCGPGGTEQGVAGWDDTGPYRIGPDPINPLLPQPNVQAEHPVNEGTFESSYVMFMLGMNASF